MTPNLLSMMLQCDCQNSKVFLLSAALDTLRRLCNKSETYKTSDNLHIWIFLFGKFILKITSPRPVAQRECPSTTPVSCGVFKTNDLIKELFIITHLTSRTRINNPVAK